MNIFTEVRSSQQKILGIPFFLCNKIKNRIFFGKLWTQKLSFEKNLTKIKFRITFDLRQLELLEVLRTFKNWARFQRNLNDKYSIVFYEICSVAIFGV